jgi:hypothetical protein
MHFKEILNLSLPLVPAKRAHLGYSPKMLDEFFRRPCTLHKPGNGCQDWLFSKRKPHIPDFHFWEALLVWHGDGSKGVTELARSEVDPVITCANLFPSSK